MIELLACLLAGVAVAAWLGWAIEHQKCKWLEAMLERADARYDRLTEELPKQLSPWTRAAEAQSKVVRPSAPEARAQVLSTEAIKTFRQKMSEKGYHDDEINKMLVDVEEQTMGVGFP